MSNQSPSANENKELGEDTELGRKSGRFYSQPKQNFVHKL